jgi:CxxC-x17-CxxC domain-containing protein
LKDVEEEINSWAANRESSSSRSSSNKPNASKSSDSSKLYDVVCSACGKNTKVVFEPTPGKPVYCKNCLKKIKDDKHTKEAVNATMQDELRGVGALAGLGIEFNPAPPQNKQSRSKDFFGKEVMLGNISFHDSKNRLEGREQPKAKHSNKRKEINLSDLRKVLEESLEKKDEKDSLQAEK